jgi:hypothetical protein
MWDASMDGAESLLGAWRSTASACSLWGGAKGGRSEGGGYALWEAAHSWGGAPLMVILGQIRLGWVRLWYVQFRNVRLG